MSRSSLVAIVGFAFFLSACGGSGGSQSRTGSDSACQDSGCESAPPDALPGAPLVCGGANVSTCPQGYRCVDDPADGCDPATGIGDCGGICVLGEELPGCGGLAGGSCGAGFVCVDDPADACEGGPEVDCPGVCQREPDGQCTADSDCPQLGLPCPICSDGSLSCPHARCDQGVCTFDFKPCPEPQLCGGISGLSCAPGFRCVDDPGDDCVPEAGGADCRGICLPEQGPPACGGITGEVCPPDFECVDDPSDTCDPRNGGADCPGLCEPADGGECKSDAECPPLRAPCGVCPDGTDACPSSFCVDGRCSLAVPSCPQPPVCGSNGSVCKPGEVCVPDPNNGCDPATGVNCSAVCVPEPGPDPEPRPCGDSAGDTCPEGYVCVYDVGDGCTPDPSGTNCGGVCKPVAPPVCQTDDECPHVLAPCSQCADGSYACPHSQCRDGLCSVTFDACTQPGFCGGIAGFPCPLGFTCIDDPGDDCDPNGGGADCGGVCVREDEPRQCDDAEGKPCPKGYECVEPPNPCDPATGIDCLSICRPAPSEECTSDAVCPQIGAPCRLCADGSAACPRSFCENGACRVEFETCAGEP